MITIDASVWISGLDQKDVFHPQTVEFFRRIISLSITPRTPSFALVEVACALGRRKRDAQIGLEAVEKLREWPQLEILHASDYLPDISIQEGLKYFLRSGDATYAATAHLTGTTLVSWDQELIGRAGAMTPTDWLASRGGIL